MGDNRTTLSFTTSGKKRGWLMFCAETGAARSLEAIFTNTWQGPNVAWRTKQSGSAQIWDGHSGGKASFNDWEHSTLTYTRKAHHRNSWYKRGKISNDERKNLGDESYISTGKRENDFTLGKKKMMEGAPRLPQKHTDPLWRKSRGWFRRSQV